MKKAGLQMTFLVLCAFLLSFLLSFGSMAESQAQNRDIDKLENAMTYDGMSMRLFGDASGIRSLWSMDHTVIRTLEAKGYTVSYGAIMGSEQTSAGLREDASALSLVRDEKLGFRLSDGVENAAVCVVYETGGPKYVTNTYVYENANAKSFAYTTLFGDTYEVEAFYNAGFVYRGFCALTKNGETQIAYVDRAGGDLVSAVSLTDIASFYYHSYTGENKEAYRRNRLLLRVLSFADTRLSVDADATTAELLSDGETYLLTDRKALAFTVSDVRATGFYRVTARLNRNERYIPSLVTERAAVGTMPAYTSAYSFGTKSAYSNDASSDAYLATSSETVTLGYTYLIAGAENTLTLTSEKEDGVATGTLGLSDVTLTLVDLPIASGESILLRPIGNRKIEEDEGGVTPAENAQGASLDGISSISFEIRPDRTGIYSATVLAHMKNAALSMTVTDSLGHVQLLENREAEASALPNASPYSAAPYALTGECRLCLQAGETYTVTLSGNTADSRLYIEFLLLQRVDTYRENDNVIRTNLWEAELTGGERLSDRHTYFVKQGDTLTFTVEAKQEGMYRVRMLETHAENKRLAFVMSTLENTYRYNSKDQSFVYYSRAEIGTSDTAPTVTDEEKNAFIVDQSKLQKELSDAEVYGYIYLVKGQNKVSIKMNSASTTMGIAAIEFEMDAPFDPDTDIRIKAAEGATLQNVATSKFDSTTGLYKIGDYSATANPSLTYSFHVDEAGRYEIYAYGGVTGKSGAKTATAALSIQGITNPDFTAKLSYQHNSLYMAIGDNIGNTGYSIAFGKIDLAAGDYTVTFAPEVDQRANRLSDIRIVRQKLTYVPAKDATCTAGNLAYYYDAAKDLYYSDAAGTLPIDKASVILSPVKEHAYAENWTLALDATCVQKGYETASCVTCGTPASRVIDARGHSFSSAWYEIVAATCTEDGEKSCVCDRCGKTVTRVIPAGHTYGDWETEHAPTLSSAGNLVRYCQNNSSHTEVYALPRLDVRNGYKLYDHCGDVSVTAPTFASEGDIFFYIRVDNQSFFYQQHFPSLNGYYAAREGVILYEIENLTPPTGASFNTEAETLILPANTEVAFTVNAPEAGFYALYIKYANLADSMTMIQVYNDTDTAWTAYASSNIEASRLTTDMIYELREDERLADFPEKECTVVYLQEGNNDLRMSFSKKIGISDMLFIQEELGDTVALHAYGKGHGSNNNGYKINPGNAPLEIDFEVPTDGVYRMYALMSTSGGNFRLSSKERSFPTQYVSLARRVGNTSLDGQVRVCSTYFTEITTLPLQSGTNTVQFTMDPVENYDNMTPYLHMNYLVLVREGDIENADSLTAIVTRSPNTETHTITVTAEISGVDPDTKLNDMRVVFEGYYTHQDGSETAFYEELSKTSYSQKLVFRTEALTEDMDGVSYRIRVYNADKTKLLYSDRLYHYSTRDTLTVYMVADLHYTGSNTTQLLRKYQYEENHVWAWAETVLKTYNSNSVSCDIYGMTTDEKAQRVMDDIIQRYEAGEFDILFFQGDSSMNDGNYREFGIAENVIYGTREDFWTSPLNLDVVVTEQYYSQLADHGIPFYCANGNHDYIMDYNADKTEISYEVRESMYHYRELFGHKNADGTVYDATPVDFFVPVIRRDGEVRIVSALSSAELSAFQLEHAGDWNCYDYYVSEDTLCDTDIRLGGFLMTAGYQIDSFDYYMQNYVYMTNPDGTVSTQKDFLGQTYRMDYHTMDVLNAMGPQIDAYEAVYVVGHNFASDLTPFLIEHENIRGMFYGDLHEQVYGYHGGLVQSWCCGALVGTFDVYSYFERDPETGVLTKTPDIQYWDKKDGKVTQDIAGQFAEYPYSSLILHVRGTESYMERSHISFYYQNTQPAYNIMFNRVVGKDPMYERAVDYTREAGTSFRVGNRTLYVGGDTFIVGEGATHLQIGRSYEVLHYNAPELILAPTDTELLYTVCDLAGRALNAAGKPVIVNGGTALTVTLSSTAEGTTFSLFGETYYILSKSGGVVGHYLYDENGDFVYVDKSGNYVFYDFYRDENGDIMKEYFFEDENGGFVSLGFWNEEHTKYTLYNGTYTHLGGSYTDENGDTKTTAGIWLSGDKMTVSRLDLTHSDADQLNMVIASYKNCQYKVSEAEITVQNGVLVRGEGFVHKSYAHRFVDAEGNEVSESDVQRKQLHTWTYSLVDRAGYTPGDDLTADSFQITDNKMEDVYGLYMPTEAYGSTWLTR